MLGLPAASVLLEVLSSRRAIIGIILTFLLLVGAFSAIVHANRSKKMTATQKFRLLSDKDKQRWGWILLAASFLPVNFFAGFETGVPIWFGLASLTAVVLLWIETQSPDLLVKLGFTSGAASFGCLVLLVSEML